MTYTFITLSSELQYEPCVIPALLEQSTTLLEQTFNDALQ